MKRVQKDLVVLQSYGLTVLRSYGLVILILLFSIIDKTYSQTDPMLFQQTHVRGMINPAATGKGGDITNSLSVRQQWIGFVGTSTQVLLVNGFVNSLTSGFGLTCIFDGYGPQQTKNIKANYAFFVPYDDEAFFAMGLGLGVMNNTYKGGDYFISRDPHDLSIPLETQSKTLPDFDFGVEFNTRNFELGASITHITYGYRDQMIMRPMRNYFLYTRAKFPINNNWDFIPGITLQNNRKVNAVEVNTGLRYNNNLYVNFAYRNPMNLGLGVGINLNEEFRFVYSYDYGFDNLSSYNSGTHEITVSYSIRVNTTYIKNRMRFFKWKMF